MTNRLSKESSPYLLQHQNNPVDWFPWGDEALRKAKDENKPILLSIGYSACHWCHVMEHESFENSQIASLMNENFINIKVDREERPDLDQIYQNVAQLITKGGGWPLTVFLTPDLKPFFGGTYFPPEDRYGRPGFGRVLTALSEAFRNDLASVQDNADKLTEMIQSLEDIPVGEGPDPSQAKWNWGRFTQITEELLSRVDWVNGGLGDAPKFPNAMIFTYLWRFGCAENSNRELAQKAREATLLTLRKMAMGGIYDQLGGGFHRYSVDDTWSVPHFEKMLYDNALLMKLYAEVLLSVPVSGSIEDQKSLGVGELSLQDLELFLRVLTQTFDYLCREMVSPQGVFYSAQDADSEGEEGKCFVWDLEELARKLTEKEAEVFALRYGVSPKGNFEHGKTVLFQWKKPSEIAQATQLELDDVTRLLESASRKLLAERQRRIQPGLDHKVLVSWNGLMISGLVWAAQAFQVYGRDDLNQKAKQTALQAFDFLKSQVSLDQGRLASTFQSGQPKGNGYLDDYAFLAMAALELSRWMPDQRHSESLRGQAAQWLQAILKHFKDPRGFGYFFTSDDHEKLIQRPKSLFDQAIPSGIAVTLTGMRVLGELDSSENGTLFLNEVAEQMDVLSDAAERSLFGMGEFLCLRLLDFLGPVGVSGAEQIFQKQNGMTHPHVFLQDKSGIQPGGPGMWVACHRNTCSLPMSEDEARNFIEALLLSSA